MTLVRWEPFRELSALHNEMDRVFGPFLGHGRNSRQWVPAIDYSETDSELVLKADLPGMAEDDVQVEVHGDILTVSGERKAEEEEKREGFYRVERSFGSFSRSIRVPEGVDPESIKARFSKGVLEVRIPKPEEPKEHRVQIEIGGDTVEGEATEKK